MSAKVDIRKRFLKLAYDQLNPDLSTIDGLEQVLVNWYCFQYNVPPNDDKLLSMTVEELLVLQQMHKLKDNPQLAEEFDPNHTSYEEWLQKEMGEEYRSPEDMIKTAEQLEAEEQELLKQTPDIIETDFAQFGTEE